MRMKHVFGHDRLMTTVSGRRYLYAVNAFSQVNESMLPVLCETVEAMVRGEDVPEPGLPESFNVLVKELQSLGLQVDLFKSGKEKTGE